MRALRLQVCALLIFLSAYLPVYADSFVESWLDWFGDEVSDSAGSPAFPLLDIPPGGRFEAMAGAYTAVGGDLGSLESNPAGTAASTGPNLSFFHHEWIADSAIESVGFINSAGPVGFGFEAKYFRVPFTEYDEAGERVTSGAFTEVIGIANASLRFINLRNISLSAGANVKAAVRHVPERIAPNQSGFSFPFDIGILSNIRLLDFSRTDEKNFSLGFSLKNVGPAVKFLEAPLPTELSGGLAYRPLRFLLLSGDVSVPVNTVDMAFYWDDLSYAAGVSVRFTSFLSIHSGARIETGRPGFALGATVRLGKLSFDATYSMDLALGINPLDSLSIGTTLDLKPDADGVSGR